MNSNSSDRRIAQAQAGQKENGNPRYGYANYRMGSAVTTMGGTLIKTAGLLDGSPRVQEVVLGVGSVVSAIGVAALGLGAYVHWREHHPAAPAEQLEATAAQPQLPEVPPQALLSHVTGILPDPAQQNKA